MKNTHSTPFETARIAALPLAALAFAATTSVFADPAYIENTDLCGLDTGYYVKPTTRVELDFQLNSAENTDSADWYILDERSMDGSTALNTHFFNFFFTKSTHASRPNQFGWSCVAPASGTSGAYQFPGLGGDTARHLAIIDAHAGKGYFYTEDTLVKEHDFTRVFTTPVPGNTLKLFGRYTFSGPSFPKAKIYGFKIYEYTGATDKELVHDYTPAVKGGVPGLYDRKTGGFLANGCVASNGASVGVFVAGGDIETIEDDPYIESDGTAQTGINARYFYNAQSRVEIDFAILDTDTKQQRVFGADTASPRSSFYIQGTGKVAFGFDKADHTAFLAHATDLTADTMRHVIYIDQPNGKAHYLTGGITSKTIDIASTPAETAAIPIALFGSATDATGFAFSGNNNSSKARIYRARFWDGDTLVHDYSPLVKGGVPGFLDAVDGAFITGENVAALSAGPSTPSIPDDPFVATVGNDYIYGMDSRFDTGYIPTCKTRCELDYALAENFPNLPTGSYTNTSGAVVNWDWYCFAAIGDGGVDNRFAFYLNKSGAGWCGSGIRWQLFTGISRQKTAKDIRRTAIVDNPGGYFAIKTAGYPNIEVHTNACADTVAYTKSIKIAAVDTGTSSFSSLKIYGFKIFEDGTLVRDFRPYVSNSVPGLRCDLTGTFLSNGGVKALVECGGSIPMDGSASCDAWISSSTTDTFSIDTGYKVGLNTRMDAEFSFLARTREVFPVAWTGNYPQQFPFEASGNLTSRIYVNGSNGAGALAWNNSKNSNWTSTGVTMKPGDRYFMTVQSDNGNGSARLVVGGETKYDNSASPIAFDTNSSSSRTIKLFSNATANGNWAMMKLYAFRIYEKESGEWVLKREFLPYTDGTRTGLIDTVDGGVYWNTISDSPDFTMGGKGVDGAEKWVKALPATAEVSQYNAAVTLTAAAVGAKSYKWTLNGEVIPGATGESITAAWRKGGYDSPDVYTCTAVYSVFGVETEGAPVSCTVARLPDAFVLTIR